MTDQQFYQADSYTIELNDFRSRFCEPNLAKGMPT
jgi:hypothetical protein